MYRTFGELGRTPWIVQIPPRQGKHPFGDARDGFEPSPRNRPSLLVVSSDANRNYSRSCGLRQFIVVKRNRYKLHALPSCSKRLWVIERSATSQAWTLFGNISISPFRIEGGSRIENALPQI
jgi:hypothetical protein